MIVPNHTEEKESYMAGSRKANLSCMIYIFMLEKPFFYGILMSHIYIFI